MFILAILFAALTGTAPGDNLSILIPVQDEWELQFKEVAQLNDGSYAICMGMVMEDLDVLQISSDGAAQNDYKFSVPGRALESGGWIIPTRDNGCYVAAYSEPRATGVDSDIAVVKLAADFTEDWTAVIGEGTDEVFSCFGAAETTEGGIAILVGAGYPGDDTFVRAYKSDGEFDWEYNLDSEEGYLPMTIGSVEAGTLILLSHQWENTTYMLLIDNSGDLQWTLELPFKSRCWQASIEETCDGYVAYFSDGDNERSAVTVVVNESGYRIGTGQFTHGMLVQDVLIEDRSTILLAGTRVIDGETSAVLEAYDLQGNLFWKRRLTGSQEDGFTSVCPVDEGGYALFGYSFSEDESEDSYVLLIVTGPEGVVEGGANPSQIPMPTTEIQTH